MDLESSESVNEIAIKKFIDGKSFDSLVVYLEENGLNTSEAFIELKLLNDEYHLKRTKRANKDLLIALIFISIPLIELLLYLSGLFRIKIGILEFCCLFAWRPFMMSYLRVRKDKKRFASL